MCPLGRLVSETKSTFVIHLKLTQMGLGKGLVDLVKRWWTLTNQLESEDPSFSTFTSTQHPFRDLKQQPQQILPSLLKLGF